MEKHRTRGLGYDPMWRHTLDHTHKVTGEEETTQLLGIGCVITNSTTTLFQHLTIKSHKARINSRYALRGY